jgi:predicted MFS family arabinose efflux permease
MSTSATTADPSARGKAVLMLAHVAGMIDLVALPVWVGALMQHYRLGPQQAGITVTLFLVGVVGASVLAAPRFTRLPHRAVAGIGFGFAALMFGVASRQPVAPESAAVLALLHALAGVGVGCGLSVTHGAIGRSANPHRLFAFAGLALGLFAVVFFGAVPPLLAATGAGSLFVVFGGLMALAAGAASVAFPASPAASAQAAPVAPLPPTAWFAIAAVVCLTLTQATVFSFVERIGVERGFGVDRVNGVLVAVGLVNLLPAMLAAGLERRWRAQTVGLFAPLVQAALALVICNATSFAPYAAAASVYVFVVIFTHTFLFGLIARLDTSGRAVALTPAMLMVGSAIGPALGGALVQGFGPGALGLAAVVIAAIAMACVARVRRALRGEAAAAVSLSST